MNEDGTRADRAERLADQAAEAAARLKVGTWESVQALALTSIALSLAEIGRGAEASQD